MFNPPESCSLLTMAQSFSVGLIQMACSQVPEENVEKACIYIQQAARDGAAVICLPELFRTQYFCQREDTECFDLAESASGGSIGAIRQVAKHMGVVVVVPFFEHRAPGLYHNSVVVFDRTGEQIGLYRKMHIPDDPGYYEKFYFTPGDRGFHIIDTSVGKLGVLICWDQWFPEAARLMTLEGADILLYPTAIGWHPTEKDEAGQAQQEAWLTVQRGHAIANGVYVAAVNRVGYEQGTQTDGGLEFWGHSFACDPFGIMLREASVDKEEVLIIEVNRDRIEDVRRNWPFLRDRRVDAYDGILQRYADHLPKNLPPIEKN